MNVKEYQAEYERQGGFADEFRSLRQAGEAITKLEQDIITRGCSVADRNAIRDLKASLETVRENIQRARNAAATET